MPPGARKLPSSKSSTEDLNSPQLVMAFELGTRIVRIYKGSFCDWFVFVWDGAAVKAIECSCAEQAFDVFDRCLGQLVGEA